MKWEEGEAIGLLGPQAHPFEKPVRPAWRDKTFCARSPGIRPRRGLAGWLSHAGSGCCLTWAGAAKIPANPVAACIISPNIARNRPAIHGSNWSRVAHANTGPAWTPALSGGRCGWLRGGVEWGPQQDGRQNLLALELTHGAGPREEARDRQGLE